MTIEELKAKWEDDKDHGEAAILAFMFMPKLIAVAQAAKRAWPRTMCEIEMNRTCAACDLKHAVEELENEFDS